MSQEIQLYNRIQDPVLASSNLGKGFALMFGLNSEAEGTFLAFASMAENKTPFDIVRTYDVVKGRLRKKALAIYAEFRARGGKVKWIATGNDGKAATAEFTFEGQTITETFTIEDARRQNLVKADSNWQKTPGNMLRARVLSNAIAMLCPEIVAGVSGNPEDDAEPGEAKPLLPQRESIEPKPANVTAVHTVQPLTSEQQAQVRKDLDSVSQPLSEKVADEQAAQEKPAKPVVTNWVNPKDPKKVSAEGAAALGELIPTDKQILALKWMEQKQWIPPMGSLLDVSPQRARLVYDQPESFLKKLTPAA